MAWYRVQRLVFYLLCSTPIIPIIAAILLRQQNRNSTRSSSADEPFDTDTAALQVSRSEQAQQLQNVTRRSTRPSLNLFGSREQMPASPRDSVTDTDSLRLTLTDIEDNPPQQFVPGLDLPVPNFPVPYYTPA